MLKISDRDLNSKISPNWPGNQSHRDKLRVIISTNDGLIKSKNARVEFFEKMPTNECSLKRGRGGTHLPVSPTGALLL